MWWFWLGQHSQTWLAVVELVSEGNGLDSPVSSKGWTRPRSCHYGQTSAEVVIKRWNVIGLGRIRRELNTGATKADVCGSAEYMLTVVLCLFVYLNLWS